ncbi:MAG TPA: glycosyltransferase [Thermoanaerobaculia bacterium]|nr:glycosyltransferase [Thermoanaerobaculia bacterium]
MKERSEPLVSIVIPCFNQGKYLAEAIESSLAQTHPSCEVIVVDDGSTDSTASVASRYPTVRYLFQSNSGVSAARNRGLEASGGELIVFLDADDRLLPHAVETGLRLLGGDPGAAFVRGMVDLLIDGERHPTFSLPPMRSDPYKEMLGGNFIWCTASVLYRRTALLAVGGFDPDRTLTDDLDLYFRITRRQRIICHDSIVAQYRFHSEGKGRNSVVKVRETMRVFARQVWFVAPRPRLWLPWVAGMRVCLGQHRENILREARVARCRGDRGRFRAVLPVVARYYPWAVPSLLRPVRRSNTLEFVVTETGATITRKTEGRGSLILHELHPAVTRPGEGFNRQPDGTSALAVRCDGARPGAVVFFAGKPLETTYGGSSLLTAAVPEELYRDEGFREVFIRSL